MEDSPPDPSIESVGEVIHKTGCPGQFGLGGGLSVEYDRCPACGEPRSPPASQLCKKADSGVMSQSERLPSDSDLAATKPASGSMSLANFEQSAHGMMNMFRFGSGEASIAVGSADGEQSMMGQSSLPVDELECTLTQEDKAELRRLQQEKGLLNTGPALPTAKRKPRVAAMDNVAGGDVYCIIVNALLESFTCESELPSLSKIREKAISIWVKLGRGKRDSTLKEIEMAVVEGQTELQEGLMQQLLGQGDFSLEGRQESASVSKYPPVLGHRAVDPGDRSYMEDFAVCLPSAFSPAYLYADPDSAPTPEAQPDVWGAVFDGHMGVEAAEYGVACLHSRFFSQPTDSVEERFLESFRSLDADFAKFAAGVEIDSGACGYAVLHRPAHREVWSAWVGDCLGFMCRGKEEDEDDFDCIELGVPHNLLQNESEKELCQKRGGRLLFGGGRLRLEGALQITRSIGDRPFRGCLCQTPEIKRTALTDRDEFVVIGSDGLFDEMKPTDVVEFIRQSKGALDEWYDQQRRILRIWERAGSPLPSKSRPRQKIGSPISPPLSAIATGLSTATGRRVSVDSRATGQRHSSLLHGEVQPTGRRWSVWAPEDAAEEVKLPPRLQTLYQTLQKLVADQDELREGITELEAEDAVPAVVDDKLPGLMRKAFSKSLASCDSYQIVTDAVIAEAFTQKASGRDNTSAVILFFESNSLTSSERALIAQIRNSF